MLKGGQEVHQSPENLVQIKSRQHYRQPAKLQRTKKKKKKHQHQDLEIYTTKQRRAHKDACRESPDSADRGSESADTRSSPYYGCPWAILGEQWQKPPGWLSDLFVMCCITNLHSCKVRGFPSNNRDVQVWGTGGWWRPWSVKIKSIEAEVTAVMLVKNLKILQELRCLKAIFSPYLALTP